jgi:8-oxo-dGTP pyrophosphatase MutT (NUDIX family)
MRLRRSGDGFLTCSDGRSRWGRFGAAGVVFVFQGDAGPEVMLQLRSALAHEGGTWSCPGGAIDQGETPFEAAMRESAEEVGDPPESYQVLGEHVFAPADDWTYTTAVVAVTERFGRSLNFETTDVRWVPVPSVDHLPLHPGFATSWPAVREIVLG